MSMPAPLAAPSFGFVPSVVGWEDTDSIPVGEASARCVVLDGITGRVWSDGGTLYWRSDYGETDSAPASSMTHFVPQTRVQAALRAAKADAPKGRIF